MIRIDWLTDNTGKPVCRATRSAVRCRVPDSSVGMLGSGTKCTAARTIRAPSVDSTTPPSILANSRSLVAANSTSIGNPPVQSVSTTLSYPSTIKAPVFPRRMRSNPSLRAVPGATRPKVDRRRSSRSGGTRPPESVGVDNSSVLSSLRQCLPRVPTHMRRQTRPKTGRAYRRISSGLAAAGTGRCTHVAGTPPRPGRPTAVGPAGAFGASAVPCRAWAAVSWREYGAVARVPRAAAA